VAIGKDGSYFVTDEVGHQIQVFDSTGRFLRRFASVGTGNGQLRQPRGIGVLSNGNVVVSEFGNDRLQIFTPQGQFVSLIGVGMLKSPSGLSIDSEDFVHVADSVNHQVLVFLPTGLLVKIFRTGTLSPLDVCVDNEGRVIVCGGNEILMF